ncbi:MAG: saccharopine dehydrogenase NADP-binding domain-containing protein [Bacteroidetes bacterium]|nr:saccharopine dehydrogenase NADP-binding domain-containing protein [Bacteroidota bacterium]
MRNILLIGAGRSSSFLIKYLLDHSAEQNWQLTVGDISEKLARQKIGNHPNGKAISFDTTDEKMCAAEISKSDLVVSMLPAHMHLPVAEQCIRLKKNLVTASYVSKEMESLDQDAKQNGIIILNECGLDPGIDHMSAMKIISDLKSDGREIISFKSFTGGLVAPESNDNPWGYKFSWNPRNVILAGQGTAKYIMNSKYKYIPYNRLFSAGETIHVKGTGSFDGYANRDSLAYRKAYGLEKIPTMLRGTLRHQGFCRAWNVFVQLGLTDDSYTIEDSEHLTYRKLVEAFLPDEIAGNSVSSRLALFMNLDEHHDVMEKIRWTGMLEDQLIGLDRATPAQILQDLLEKKWVLKKSDKDMVVMQHQFIHQPGKSGQGTQTEETISSLVVKGEDSVYTAMAKMVGLPLAIAAKLIINNNVKLKGVQIPVHEEIYKPILDELEESGIEFIETTKKI